jgi:choline dehydrogenase-like flavoprotein
MASPDPPVSDPKGNSEKNFEVVVIGSGFGGTIAAIELGKVMKKWNDTHEGAKKRVCILERGTWYMTPEAWLDSKEVATFVKNGDRPHSFWPMPDNRGGMLNLVTKLRILPSGKGMVHGLSSPIVDAIGDIVVRLLGKRTNPNGLYDVKNFKETFVLTANGVGGGSLVYSNVTISPEPEILDEVFYERDRGGEENNSDEIWKPKWKVSFDMLDPYMMYAMVNR